MREDVWFIDDHLLRIGEIDFYCSALEPQGPTPGALPVIKHRDNVQRYIDLGHRIAPNVIVELGIALGGSTAMLNELYRPEVLVAIELDGTPAPVLSAYITRQGAEAVHPFYGIDQADRERLRRIIDSVIGDRPIDVVIDDASHRYAETRSSFETLFPRLPAGGRYLIEDWNVDQLLADAVAEIRQDPSSPQYSTVIAHDARRDESTEPPPLTQLAFELILVRGSAGHAIRKITINENWVIIERGAGQLDRDVFRLTDLVRNHHFGFR